MIKSLIGETLAQVVYLAEQQFGQSLLAVIQYGSSVDCVKAVSDLDVLFVFDELPPSRRQRLKKFEAIESQLNDYFLKIENEGFHYEFSPNPVTLAEIQKIRSFYFDFADRSRILFERDQTGEEFLKRVRQEIIDSKSQKKRIGSRWYWKIG